MKIHNFVYDFIYITPYISIIYMFMIKLEFGFDKGKCGLCNKGLFLNWPSLAGNRGRPQTLNKNKFQRERFQCKK